MKSLNRPFATPRMTRLLLACLLFAVPLFSNAQVGEKVQEAQTAIEEAQKQADDAKYAVSYGKQIDGRYAPALDLGLSWKF